MSETGMSVGITRARQILIRPSLHRSWNISSRTLMPIIRPYVWAVLFYSELVQGLQTAPTQPPVGCLQTAAGAEYRGGVDNTVSGKVCQAWSEQTPQQHTVFPANESLEGICQVYFCGHLLQHVLVLPFLEPITVILFHKVLRRKKIFGVFFHCIRLHWVSDRAD